MYVVGLLIWQLSYCLLQFVFEGAVGKSYKGDIALDDISSPTTHPLCQKQNFTPYVFVCVLQFVFEGVVGKSYKGDIALDDISVNDGQCPPSGMNRLLFLFYFFFKSSALVFFSFLIETFNLLSLPISFCFKGLKNVIRY